jgi:16S rRNA (guanine527-N7)-methyltransferase
VSEVVLPEPLVPAARVLFADRLPLARRYAELLGTEGVVRGLIGPREAPRIWDRHLLNCTVVAEIIPDGYSVTDVGSGAGLPGIPLALARPDLRVILVDSLARRTAFLTEVVDALGLGDRVEVVRGRAEELADHLVPADAVVARAVAPLDRLAGWCLPLTRIGGRLLALKGATAAEEVDAHLAAIARLGGGTPTVRRCGVELLDEPTTVVEIVRESAGPRRPGAAARRTDAPERRAR